MLILSSFEDLFNELLMQFNSWYQLDEAEEWLIVTNKLNEMFRKS